MHLHVSQTDESMDQNKSRQWDFQRNHSRGKTAHRCSKPRNHIHIHEQHYLPLHTGEGREVKEKASEQNLTGANPSAGSTLIPNSIFTRLKRPSITLGNEKYGRSSSCK